ERLLSAQRVADHADARGIDLRARLEVVDRPPRVPDVLPLEAAALGEAVQGLEALVLRLVQLAFGVLALAEAEGVGSDGEVAAPRELDRVVLVGRGSEAGGTGLAHLELPAVLVMAQQGRVALRPVLRDEDVGGHALAV